MRIWTIQRERRQGKLLFGIPRPSLFHPHMSLLGNVVQPIPAKNDSYGSENMNVSFE